MHLNTEKTQSETDVAIFKEITNHMSDFIVKTYATLIKKNLELFGMTEFITKRKDILDNATQTDGNLSEDALKLGFCIDKFNNLIKSKNLYAESDHITLLSVAILLNDVKSVEKLLKQKIHFPHCEISFIYAIKAKSIDIIKLLLEQEHFQKMLDMFVQPTISFLYYALSAKKFDVASYLIQQQGAKLHPGECLNVLALKELYSHPELLNQILSFFRSYEKGNIPAVFQFAPDFQVVKLLHAHGMRLTEQFTPSFLKELHVTSSLKFAVYTGDTEFCAHLLETEEKPESIQEELYLALFKSNTEILKILLNNCHFSDYDPAVLLKKILTYLPNAKQLELIPTLLGNEYFNFRLKFDDFVNIFETALENCNFQIARLMLKSVYFSNYDLSLVIKIFQSILNIPANQVENFCLATKDLIHQPLANFDFFYYAIRSRNKMLVQGLINCGADNQIVYKNKTFPLLVALLTPHPDEEILKILAAFSTDKQIYYTLSYSIQENLNTTIYNVIIKVIGSEKIRNLLDMQLMIKTVLTKNSVALSYFLEIHVFKDTLEELTLLDFAILLNNADLIVVCRNAGIKTNFVQDIADPVPSFCGHKISEIPSAYLILLHLCISSKPEDIEKLKKIDMSNLNLNYQLPHTLFTPLMLATLHQNEEAIKFLLKNNANPKVECRNELNATRIAILGQNVKIVRLFLEVDDDLIGENSAQDNSSHSYFIVRYKYTNKRNLEEIPENNSDNSSSRKKTCI